MKCFILLFAVLTATTARHVSVHEDGSIDVHGDHGKQVIIHRPQGPDGERIIEIAGHGGHQEQRIQINDDDHLLHEEEDHQVHQHGHKVEESEGNRLVRNVGQEDVLESIFKQFQGRLDEESYERLLRQVELAVERQQIHRSVYEALQNVHQHEHQERLVPGFLIRRPQVYYDSFSGRYHNLNGQEQGSYHHEGHERRVVGVEDHGRHEVEVYEPEVHEPEVHQRYLLEHEGHRYHHGQEHDDEHRREYYGLNQHQWHGEGHQGYGGYRHGRYETYADLLRRQQHENHQIFY